MKKKLKKFWKDAKKNSNNKNENKKEHQIFLNFSK